MIVKLLTEHHLKFLSLKGGCTDSSESTLVKMPLCWKSHVMTYYVNVLAKEVLMFILFCSVFSYMMIFILNSLPTDNLC